MRRLPGLRCACAGSQRATAHRTCAEQVPRPPHRPTCSTRSPRPQAGLLAGEQSTSCLSLPALALTPAPPPTPPTPPSLYGLPATQHQHPAAALADPPTQGPLPSALPDATGSFAATHVPRTACAGGAPHAASWRSPWLPTPFSRLLHGRSQKPWSLTSSALEQASPQLSAAGTAAAPGRRPPLPYNGVAFGLSRAPVGGVGGKKEVR